ncbi:hypothetical protein QS713_02395 [Gleimia hominis]|uniref:Uncharacterized protein n=1 Tax=Gleimia hominis TaxID=595468 RepID=A0ABU3I970_9ACTO|nr:hypothetical protein [Gleimia hominis]MDT3766914.1 hypothetical protein [Gleimia hominis]
MDFDEAVERSIRELKAQSDESMWKGRYGSTYYETDPFFAVQTAAPGLFKNKGFIFSPDLLEAWDKLVLREDIDEDDYGLLYFRDGLDDMLAAQAKRGAASSSEDTGADQ